MLPDEIIWVVPESLEQTMRELDDNFPSTSRSPEPPGKVPGAALEEPPPEGSMETPEPDS